MISCVASYGLSAAGVSSDAGVFNETRALQELELRETSVVHQLLLIHLIKRDQT